METSPKGSLQYLSLLCILIIAFFAVINCDSGSDDPGGSEDPHLCDVPSISRLQTQCVDTLHQTACSGQGLQFWDGNDDSLYFHHAEGEVVNAVIFFGYIEDEICSNELNVIFSAEDPDGNIIDLHPEDDQSLKELATQLAAALQPGTICGLGGMIIFQESGLWKFGLQVEDSNNCLGETTWINVDIEE